MKSLMFVCKKNSRRSQMAEGFARTLGKGKISVMVIISVATDKRVNGAVPGLAIGLTVVFDVLIGGPVTGGSMNPARSLEPALFSHFPQASFLYGSLIGGGLLILIQIVLLPQLRQLQISNQSSYLHGLPQESIWHKHKHIHDEHHQHEHFEGVLADEQHSHLHLHNGSHL